MTLDEMIEALNKVPEQGICAGIVQLKADKANAIIAALRAGQAMADEVPETSYARQAWDAATAKGDGK